MRTPCVEVRSAIYPLRPLRAFRFRISRRSSPFVIRVSGSSPSSGIPASSPLPPSEPLLCLEVGVGDHAAPEVALPKASDEDGDAPLPPFGRARLVARECLAVA